MANIRKPGDVVGGLEPPSSKTTRIGLEKGDEEDGDEAMVAGVRHAGRDSVHKLNLIMEAVGSLDKQTQRYLHINVLGYSLPNWMVWEKQPKLNRWNYVMQQLYGIMTNDPASTLGSIIANFLILTIVISVLSFCLETIPAFQEDREPVAAQTFTIIETVTIQIFAADYLLRLLSCPNKLKFVIEPFNIIDLVVIVPWYVITFVGADFNGTTVFRVMRLVRVFRVLKLGTGRFTRLLVVLESLRKSVDMLGLMVFFISLCIVFFATLMYYAERGNWDPALGYYVRPNEPGTLDNGEPKPSPFESIVSGFWWAIVTLMTVGYGDVFPITAGGKAIACVAMICGILTLALPISVIGSTFSSDWTAHTEEEKRKEAAGHKQVSVTSPALLQMQRLLNHHMEDMDTLVDLNHRSELALEKASSQLHTTLKTTKKHLHTEAKADLRLRRNAKSTRTYDNTPYDPQYGYLSMEHVKERYREQLPSMAEVAQDLGKRACHVARMETANACLMDPELEAIVARLAKKHADLAFLLDKYKEQEPLSWLAAELNDLRSYVTECKQAHAAITLPPGSRVVSPTRSFLPTLSKSTPTSLSKPAFSAPSKQPLS